MTETDARANIMIIGNGNPMALRLASILTQDARGPKYFDFLLKYDLTGNVLAEIYIDMFSRDHEKFCQWVSFMIANPEFHPVFQVLRGHAVEAMFNPYDARTEIPETLAPLWFTWAERFLSPENRAKLVQVPDEEFGTLCVRVYSPLLSTEEYREYFMTPTKYTMSLLQDEDARGGPRPALKRLHPLFDKE